MKEKEMTKTEPSNLPVKVSSWASKNSLLLLTSTLILSLATILLTVTIVTHKDSVHVEKYDLYPLVSKRVFLENPNDVIVNFVPLRKALRSYVEAQGGESWSLF